jgi:ADP-heptose:LPS heptosyltransferase
MEEFASLNHVINAVGQLDLDTLMAVLNGSAIFLGIDSLLGHLSAALGRPTVSIIGPESEIHWAPRGKFSQFVCLDRPCRPCVKGGCRPGGSSGCLDDLPFDDLVRPSLLKALAASA